MDMNFFKDQRVVAAIGAALALLAGLVIAITLMSKGAKTKPDADADAGSDGSLQVEMNAADGGLDVSKPLRCFVDGQFVGVLSLNECAARNGVATGALDVGLDPNGAIVAGEGDVPMQPLPQPVTAAPPDTSALPAVADAAPAAEAPAPVRAAAGGACWRFNGTDWRKVSASMSLNECVQTLFAGRCERPGAASYGRWSEQTLRLVTGRVERAYDNRTFRTLVQQSGDCSLPAAE